MNKNKNEASTFIFPKNDLVGIKRWGFKRKFFYTFVRLAVPRAFERAFRIDVHGTEHVNKFHEGTPVIFCGNHKSHLDAIIFGSAIGHPKRSIRKYVAFMANGKAMHSNVLFRQLKYCGGFPVYSDNPTPALNYSIKTLRANLAVVIFPQGGRISHSSVLSDYYNLAHEGKTGVGRIILRLKGKVPVIPFYIRGSDQALSIGSFFPKWGARMSITFGPPIYFDEFITKNTHEFYDAARIIANTIMKSIWIILKQVESSFLELLERELGSLDSIDENIDQSKIDKILTKARSYSSQNFYYNKNRNK